MDYENLWLVLEGDWSGQVYLTVPLRCIPRFVVQKTNDYEILLVGRPEPRDYEGWIQLIRVQRLLRELDRIAWPCNQGEGRGVSVVRLLPHHDPVVGGGMGGGRLTDGIWLHDEFAGCPEIRRRAERLLRLRA